jgi:hypothetical protein
MARKAHGNASSFRNVKEKISDFNRKSAIANRQLLESIVRVWIGCSL